MSLFAERVEALAKKIGISYPLLERELDIESVELSGGEMVYALACNKSSRLFLQSLAQEELGDSFYMVFGISVTDAVEETARAFYGEELWNDEPHTGKHLIIDGIKNARDVGGQLRISWKHPDAKGI